MTAEWSGFNAVLAARGVDPRRTKLYRHTLHPTYGPMAFDRWKEGRARFLSFATVQNASVKIYGPTVLWCAHFLAEKIEGVKHAARFIGVTRILGTAVAFSENSPVTGYIANEAPPALAGVTRTATPLAWEAWDQWEPLSQNLLLSWGKGFRTGAQWAYKNDKLILTELNDVTSAPVQAPEDAFTAYEYFLQRWHLTQERRGPAARLAKELKPLICEGCGLDGPAAFGPKLATRCMEAHHLSPISQMPKGGRMVDPVKHFAILCATCHRLIHGLERPDDLEGLQALWQAGAAQSR